MEAPTSEPKPEAEQKATTPAESQPAAPTSAPVAPSSAGPVALHRPPAEDGGDEKSASKTDAAKDTAPLPPMPDEPKHLHAMGPSGPGGVITATIFVMIALALLAVLVYIRSNNY